MSMEVSNIRPTVNQNVQNQENKAQNQNQRTIEANSIINEERINKQRKEENIEVTDEQLIEMIERANKALLKPPMELQFSVHEVTKRISITVTNKETDEVIREIPSEKILNMVANLYEAAGVLIDERV